jgi:hypothetical protein
MGADPVLFTWFVYPIGRGIFILASMYIAASFFQLEYVPPSSKSKGNSSGSNNGSAKSTKMADTTGSKGDTASAKV